MTKEYKENINDFKYSNSSHQWPNICCKILSGFISQFVILLCRDVTTDVFWRYTLHPQVYEKPCTKKKAITYYSIERQGMNRMRYPPTP